MRRDAQDLSFVRLAVGHQVLCRVLAPAAADACPPVSAMTFFARSTLFVKYSYKQAQEKHR